MKTVEICASKRYNVLIGGGILDRAGEFVKDITAGENTVIVTDDNVGKLYAEQLTKTLKDAGFKTPVFTIGSGERHKNAENYIKLLNFLADNGVTRTDTVIALGGGVPGDLAGFAAATYMRGTGFVQIPTTLLAAVDSSVGGKTAIDLDAGKNLAGAFYQPDLVICDYSLLKTLPEAVFADGCAEVIKYGVISDRTLFDATANPTGGSIGDIIARCVEIKRDIVVRDERETGERKLLNFGHTVGHAIEKCSGYAVSHGAAVAVGMAVVTLASSRMGICPKNCYDGLVEVLRANKLPYRTDYSAPELYNAALSDKKRGGNRITLVLPNEIGSCFLRDTPVDELESFIKLGLEQ